MNHEFGYRWATMLRSIYLIPIAAVFVYWQQGSLSQVAIIVLALISLLVLGRNALVLYRVDINDREITIKYLLPLRTNKTYTHQDIESYTELSINVGDSESPIAGFLTPIQDKRHMLNQDGAKDFEELNAVLKEIYPTASS